IEITGDEIFIDYDRNDYFTKGCLIILNNAISHGIESPAERIRRKKSEWGTIRVELKGSASEIMIDVSDDGRGFDIEAIKAKMLEAHPEAYDTIKQLSDEAVLEHLLEGTYAYKETSNMGLHALKGEVDSLKGTLRIETEKYAFSRLIITIPNEKAYVF
ncbi:MAG: two-component system, chemotaxis family, sensor kinase CheA, partial [Clostridiales bacterium]|nr:two-component system, chemotaxis family, sensor kinase CheA [Clostridiales bacterium]